MITAEATRQQAVSAANSAATFKLYGFSNGGTPEQLKAAQESVASRLAASEEAISTYFANAARDGRDPYANNAKKYYQDKSNTAIIQVADLSQHEPAMLQALRGSIEAAGFQVVRVQRQSPSPYNGRTQDVNKVGYRDGWFVELRDPGYVKEKNKLMRSNFFRALLFMKPRAETPLLPAPPKQIDGVTIDRNT